MIKYADCNLARAVTPTIYAATQGFWLQDALKKASRTPKVLLCVGSRFLKTFKVGVWLTSQVDRMKSCVHVEYHS